MLRCLISVQTMQWRPAACYRSIYPNSISILCAVDTSLNSILLTVRLSIPPNFGTVFAGDEFSLLKSSFGFRSSVTDLVVVGLLDSESCTSGQQQRCQPFLHRTGFNAPRSSFKLDLEITGDEETDVSGAGRSLRPLSFGICGLPPAAGDVGIGMTGVVPLGLLTIGELLAERDDADDLPIEPPTLRRCRRAKRQSV